MSLYPVYLDIRDQLCLVIGGGKVARRKVESLIPCGALVRLVSPEVDEALADLAASGRVDWQQRNYAPGDLQGAKLVFAATDNDEIQEQVVREANELAIPVNVITNPDACTFQVPASFNRGDLLISVATGGKSPALAARIRKELEKIYGAEYAVLTELLGDVRGKVLALSDRQEEHKGIFERMLDDDILWCVKGRKWDDLQDLLQDILPAAIDVPALVKGARDRGMKEMA
ncbi:MAG: bifunctional precorrin-2 dehydrogenase/sirohydrochlorin ferrochelatase [Thermodesulfobacteriota bacterium]